MAACCRQGLRGAVRRQHAARAAAVADRARRDVRHRLLLPQRQQRGLADAARRLPLLSGLRLPHRLPAQVGGRSSQGYFTILAYVPKNSVTGSSIYLGQRKTNLISCCALAFVPMPSSHPPPPHI